MKRKWMPLLLLLALILALPFSASARSIDPIVSTVWLEKNLLASNLIILDVRKPEAFAAGHLLNAANVPYGAWSVKRKALNNELPAPYDLPDLTALAGITKDSKVVVVSSWSTPTEQVESFRVAWTLLYMGISDVAVLEGGFTKWANEKRPLSTVGEAKMGTPYKGELNPSLFIKKRKYSRNLVAP